MQAFATTANIDLTADLQNGDTLDGITLATGNKVSDFNLRSFDPSKLDSKARKFFPLRLTNFFTDTSKIKKDKRN